MKQAAITFTVRASRAARLVVTLRDLRGRTLATWRRILKQGTQKLSLPLVPRVQHGGTRRLRLVWAGGRLEDALRYAEAPLLVAALPSSCALSRS